MNNTFTRIPFTAAAPLGRELEYISQCILEKKQLSGDGYFTEQARNFLEQQFGTKSVLLTTSCTDALEMSALLLNIQPGDEIIFPSFTFVSTLNAFVLRGAKPVYADIRKDTLNIDEKQLSSLITEKTKAIVVVHYAGVACEMDEIMSLAEKHNIHIIEDNAHGLFGKYKGKWLGTFGTLATHSFHETKNFTCGEGGALFINNTDFMDRAEIVREKGTNRTRFFRGQIDKYSWVDLGSSFLPSDILAAFLYAQLEKSEMIQKRRRELWNKYNSALASWAESQSVTLPAVPQHCDQAYHMFYILLPSLSARTSMIEFLKEQNIQSVFHYLPLHLSEMGKKLGGDKFQLPVTENISDRILRLPFYNTLSDADQSRVINRILGFSV